MKKMFLTITTVGVIALAGISFLSKNGFSINGDSEKCSINEQISKCPEKDIIVDNVECEKNINCFTYLNKTYNDASMNYLSDDSLPKQIDKNDVEKNDNFVLRHFNGKNVIYPAKNEVKTIEALTKDSNEKSVASVEIKKPNHGNISGFGFVGPPLSKNNNEKTINSRASNQKIEELKCKNKWGNVSIHHRNGKFNGHHQLSFLRKNISGVLAAYDISITDSKTNTKWQPGIDGVNVDVELTEPLNVGFKNLNLIHYLANGKTEVVKSASFKRNQNGDISSFSFIAQSFSIYAIVNTDGELITPRRFYHFYGHPITDRSGHDLALPYLFKDQSNDVVNVQIVKDGDMLKEPPIPPDIVDEYGEVISMFEGWYVVSTNRRTSTSIESKLDPTNQYFQFQWPVGVTELRMTFTNAVHVTETNDWDYFVVPLYENARFLQFNENAKNEAEQGVAARIIRRKLVAINDETGKATLKISDVEAALKNSMNEYFCGWEYLDVDNQYKSLLVYSEAGKHQDQFITVDDALFEANGGTIIQLYPYYVSAHFLHFNANAKSVDFVGSLFVRSTSNFSQVDVSGNRKGYDFGGWQAGFYDEDTKELRLGVMVTDANGNFIPNVTVTNAFTDAVAFITDAAGNIRMNEDVTLYGTWVANSSAPYRVIIWQQRVTDSKNAINDEKTYFYVTHYTSPAVSASTQIAKSLLTSFTGTAASGTNPNRTNLTTLSGKNNITGEDFTGFYYDRYGCKDATVASDGSTVVNVYYDRKMVIYSFSQGTLREMNGLYGQTLEENGYSWPTGNGLWQVGNTTVTFRDAFLPINGTETTTNITESFTWSNSTGSTPIRFYKEALDGSWTLANTVNTSGGNFSISDKYNGFTAYQYRKMSTGRNPTWGNWTSVGTYNTSTKYYGSAVSSYSELEIRFKRNKYELIYKYIDNDGSGDEHVVYDTGKIIPFEAELSGYNYAYTNSLLDWSECDITNRTFEGWFEDASLTKEFDFNGTMPDGTKIIYARWAPKKHRVIIDPNGGELLPNEATWFYVDPSKEETIEEYTPTRKYRLDLHNGTYYYHLDPWNPVKDKHTDQYDPAYSNATRLAYYTTNILEATTNDWSNPENTYTYDPGAYAFMGWFEVLSDGTLSTDPFSFGEPPTGPVTIRAIWRRLGVYTLKYESIDPDGNLETEVIYDPQHHDSGNIEDGYVADAETTLAKIPSNYDKDGWIWEGWQVIDTFNNNIPLTNIRSPGDIYIVKPAHADLNNVIHFRAVYKHIGDSTSRHIPRITDLILDSNENAGLFDGAAFEEIDGRVGIYTNGVSDGYSGLNQGVWFAGQQNNFSVTLTNYVDKFSHNNGYFLLGWDPVHNISSMIPTYYANETIGIDINSGSENILYAIWEPQIYIEFVNDTGSILNDIQLYIPGWAVGDVFRVNSVQDTYKREPFSAFQDGQAAFNMGIGERFCLVLPDGADKDFTVMGTCTYSEGNKLVIERIQPEIDGQDDIPDVVQTVYPGDDFMVAGTMKVSSTPVQVRFTNETYSSTIDVPVRYFIHDPDGTVTEITYDESKWTSFNNVKKILTGIDGNTNDIAYLLRKSSTEGVHEYLIQSIRDQYGYTTIGIGSAIADFDEWRSITKDDPSGGSYIKFYHEKLEWSRYAQIWNDYENAAIYVVFYKRIPVHVTTEKTIIGSEEDKSNRSFDFIASFEEHSKTIEYKIVTVYRSNNSDGRNPTINSITTNGWKTITSETDQHTFNSSREPETFSLKNSERHPITIYFNTDEETIQTETTSWERQGSIFNRYYTSTQTVTYHVTYQYEIATIQEAETNFFTLTSITGETGHGHSGTGTVANRTYVISSLKNVGSNGLATYTPLDTTIFTNTRDSGSITISKSVVGENEGYAFPFTVTLGETVIDKNNYIPPSGVHIGPYGKVFTFTLSSGESVTLTNLPAGASYVVEEGSHDKYVANVPNNFSGTVSKEVTNVGFVNVRKTDIAIVMDDLSSAFTGDEQIGYSISSVIGTGSTIYGDGYVVNGLPDGHILIVEHYVQPRGTSVGTYTGHVENVRFSITSNGVDVTSWFLPTILPGTLTIVKQPIVVEVTGNTATEIYDGTEHVCQGYTYVIRNTDTGNVFTNENILVSVDPNYQHAYRTDIGRSEMHLDGHINVTVPDGFTIFGVDVVQNGYMEITPRTVTIMPCSAFKFYATSDPLFNADVQGLVGDDAISYSVYREVGEDVGEYDMLVSANQIQGNYIIVCGIGVFTIGELRLLQRSTGEELPVKIPVTDELLEAAGVPENLRYPRPASDFLNEECTNTLYRWENLRLGLRFDIPLMCNITNAVAGKIELASDVAQLPPVDFGYSAMRMIQKNDTNGWENAGAIVEFSKHENDNTSCCVLGDDISGIYRIKTMLIPLSFPEVTNELFSANAAGIIETSSDMKNVMLAVPWKKMPSNPDEPESQTIADWAKWLSLDEGDELQVIWPNRLYSIWTMTKGQLIQTIEQRNVNGVAGTQIEGEVNKIILQKGMTVWLCRNNTSKKMVIAGQYSDDIPSLTIPGHNEGDAYAAYAMIANCSTKPVPINLIGWYDEYDNPIASLYDSIMFPSDDSAPFNLTWSNGEWGISQSIKVGRKRTWVWTTGYEIPAGQSVWYYRTTNSWFTIDLPCDIIIEK